MMTMQPSRLATMKTVTACEQALHLMHQSNPIAPTPPPLPANAPGISIFSPRTANSRGLRHLSFQMPRGGDNEHLNRQNTDIQFTKEIEETGKIPFLDFLVTLDNKQQTTNDYLQKTDKY